jgi:PAS domain S-box-containing protein
MTGQQSFMRVAEAVKMPALVAVLYFAAAEAAFFIGTLSDNIFAPLWPPNVVLFCVLLLVPERQWWIYILAAFPAHAAAEVGVGMAVPQLLVAFATNCLIAVINAAAVRTVLGGPPWFSELRKALLYVLITAVVSPAICAFGGAFVQISGGGAIDNYALYWAQWYTANALGSLTLGPIALIWLSEGGTSPSLLLTRQKIEAVIIAIALVLACAVAFDAAATSTASGFLPALLYAPLPLILWSAVRFGAKGASGAIVVVTVVLIWRALNAPSLFVAGDAETNVFALQIFIMALAVPVLLLGASIDEARHAAQTTRQSEERMRFTAANANIGFWHLDRSTNELWLTDHCRTLLGLPPDGELEREAIVAAIHPDDRDAMVESIRAAAYAGELALTEFRVVLPDGRMKWFLARSHAERDRHGTPLRISGFFIDITARKAAETWAEQQRKEVAHLTRVSVLGELSGAIAHELNQPLTAILSNAQAAQHMLARPNPDLDDLRETLRDIVQENTRAGEVIKRLRGLLKKGESKTEPVALDDIVHSTLRLLHSELISRKIKVHVDLADDLPVTSGDPVQLQQVLLNLAMNAMEAMSSVPPKRRLMTIGGHATLSGIELVIADRGPGISTDDKEKVFDPFFTTKEQGLGLGLSICSTIVATHGGELTLANNSDGGVTAMVRLPAEPPRIMAAAK